MKPFASAAFVSGAHIDLTGRLDAPPVMAASNPGHVVAAPGGACLNMATAAARLGLPCTIAGPVGRDPHGESLHLALRERGIVDALVPIAGQATGTYTAIVAPDGHMVIGLADLALYEAADAAWLMANCRSALEAAGLWCLPANLAAETLAGLAASAGGRCLAAATVSPAKSPRLAGILSRLDLLFTNLAEARALAGAPSATAPELAGQLMRAGVAAGTISAGGASLAYWHAGTVATLTPPPLQRIVDVNGAGDALAGVMLAGLARGLQFSAALRCAVVAAGMTLAVPDPVCRDLDWQSLESGAAAMP